MSQSSLPRIFYRRGVPIWRDVVVLQWVAQILSALLVIAFMAFFVNNVLRAAEARGLSWGYGFLREASGFPISESIIEYDASFSFARALLVGILNTLKVSLVGIVLATLLGVVAAVARLSTNWLVNKIAGAYINLIRNIPLLVQLFFWYFAFYQRLPAVKEAVELPGPIYLSQRGLYMIWFQPTTSFGAWMISISVGLGLVVGVVLYMVLSNYQLRTGKTTYPVASGLAALIALPVIGWVLVGPSPLSLTVPELAKFNFHGGLRLTTEYAGMLTGLVIYTGAFIAEVVRAGNPGRQQGPVRGRPRPGAELHAGPAPGGLSPGAAGHHPTADQPVPEPDQELESGDYDRLRRCLFCGPDHHQPVGAGGAGLSHDHGRLPHSQPDHVADHEYL